MKTLRYLLAALMLLPAAAVAGDAGTLPGKSRMYKVTVTNITNNVVITPVLVATHRGGFELFQLGEEPSPELADLAEGGATDPLQFLLDGMADVVMDTDVTAGGPIMPGMSATAMVSANFHYNRISVAGMLLPTNDSFIALNGELMPRHEHNYLALGYDAGSELNDELCVSIPGPHCGGEPFSAGLGEGYVHVSPGIGGGADLDPALYDWRNPVALVKVERVY